MTHLHPGLDDIQGRVPEHAGGAGHRPEQAGHGGVDVPVGVVSWQEANGGDGRAAVPSAGHQGGESSPLYQFLSDVMT